MSNVSKVYICNNYEKAMKSVKYKNYVIRKIWKMFKADEE